MNFMISSSMANHHLLASEDTFWFYACLWFVACLSFSFANYRPVVCVCSLIPKVIEFVTGGVGSLGQIGTFSIGLKYKLDDKFADL